MSLWSKLSRAAGVAHVPPAIPAGMRVYAVGDVHGRRDLLDELVGVISADLEDHRVIRSVIIFLGDLIDRGPDSAGVLDRILMLAQTNENVHCLLGNHEEALLRVLNSESNWLTRWIQFGGDACAASYGIAPPRLLQVSEREGADLLSAAIPALHIAYLKSFRDTIAVGGYLFVHAGIRPGVPIARQTKQDLRWIREPFLSDPKPHGAVIVHGHSVVDEPEDRGNRVGIDTGAYYSGRLTALVLEGTTRRYLVTGSPL